MSWRGFLFKENNMPYSMALRSKMLYKGDDKMAKKVQKKAVVKKVKK